MMFCLSDSRVRYVEAGGYRTEYYADPCGIRRGYERAEGRNAHWFFQRAAS